MGEAAELQVQIMGKCHFPNVYMNWPSGWLMRKPKKKTKTIE